MQRDSEWIPPRQPPRGPDIDFWRYVDTFLSAVWRRRWLVVLAVVISVGYSVQSLAKQVPVFTATGQILIEPPPRDVLEVDQMLQARSGTESYVSTRVQLLRSRDFIEYFLEREDMLPAGVSRQSPGADGAGAAQDDDAGAPNGETGGAAEEEGAPTTPPDAAPNEQTDIETTGEATPERSLFARVRGTAGDYWQALTGKLAELAAPITGTGERRRLDESVLPPEFRDYRLPRAVNRVRSAMSVRPVGGTHLVNIGWTDRDRVYATQMANAVAEAFIAYHLETQTRLAEQATDFLTGAIERLRAEIREDEQEFLALGNELGIDETFTVFSGDSPALESELEAARSQRVELQAELERLRETDPTALVDRSTPAAIRAQQLRDELASLRSERQEISRRLTDEHPRMKELATRIAETEAELREQERLAHRELIDQRRQEVQAALDAERRLQGMVAGQSGVRADQYDELMEFQALRTSLENKRSLLQRAVDRRSNMEISAQVSVRQGANIQIVEPALLPGRPANKDWLNTILYALLLGGGIGAVIAFGLDYLDNTLRTPEDVESRVGMTTLGTITQVGTTRVKRDGEYVEPVKGKVVPEVVVREQPRSRLAEEYRELRTALLLSTGGGAPSSLVITSATPGEGKTTTALNLALSLADAGKRVLLVDGDMRKPRLADILELGTPDGFSNYLAGNASWENLVRRTHLDNLLVLPSGPVPPNPAELYGSELPEAFLQEARAGVDMVIIDTPPALTVVDPLILAPLVDGVVMVVRANRTAHQLVRKAVARLEDVQGRVLGIVLNATRRARRIGYGRYSYYYSQYGYGYRYSSRDR